MFMKKSRRKIHLKTNFQLKFKSANIILKRKLCLKFRSVVSLKIKIYCNCPFGQNYHKFKIKRLLFIHIQKKVVPSPKGAIKKYANVQKEMQSFSSKSSKKCEFCQARIIFAQDICKKCP